MDRISCAFTRHRPGKFPWKYYKTGGRCAALKTMLMEQLRSLTKAGGTQFLWETAEATDTWSAFFVFLLREKIPS